MNIYEKLQNCRVELQETKLKKSGKNKFAGFEYFELKDFLPTVNNLFKKYGLFSNFSINNERMAILEIIDKDWISQEGRKDESLEFFRQNAYFFKVTFTSPIEELELKGCNKIQALGGVHTYMKRYLYINALEIVEADLFDAMTGSEELKEVKSKVVRTQNKADENTDDIFISLKQKNELKAKLGGEEFCKIMNEVKGRLTIEKYNELMGE